MHTSNHLILDYLKSLSADLEEKGYDAAEQDAILDSLQHQIFELGGNEELSTDGQLAILCQLDSTDAYPHAHDEEQLDEANADYDVVASSPEVVEAKPSSKKLTAIFSLVAFSVLIAWLVFWGIETQRNIVKLNEGVKASEAQVDNVLKRRYDLIPNLVNTVKGYAEHERALLTEVTRLRSNWATQNGAEKRATEQELEGALSRLLIVSEQYPQLKANNMFQNLMVALEGSENRITVERMRYNHCVRDYNSEIQQVPQVVIAQMMGASNLSEYREIEEEAKVAPKVEF